jgi:transcriptional regulator with XRE-family HTH domain
LQVQTEQNLTFFLRLEKLKLAKGWSWEEVAEQIGISRTMIHFIKSGKHKVTAKTWHRLEEAEKAAGTKSITRDANRESVVSAIAAAEKQSNVKITMQDIDRGYVDVPVNYRRGTPPAQSPTRLRVSTPPTKTAAQTLAAIKLDEDYGSLFVACLPAEYTTPEFLNKLTPFSYNAILDAALAMAFGLDWKRMVRKS